jgi:peptide/nickel transport system substrate-binding protein
LPSVPITVNVSWDEYTSTHFTGWPDDTSPYDVGAPYNAPNNEMVVLHLKPV